MSWVDPAHSQTPALAPARSRFIEMLRRKKKIRHPFLGFFLMISPKKMFADSLLAEDFWQGGFYPRPEGARRLKRHTSEDVLVCLLVPMDIEDASSSRKNVALARRILTLFLKSVFPHGKNENRSILRGMLTSWSDHFSWRWIRGFFPKGVSTTYYRSAGPFVTWCWRGL